MKTFEQLGVSEEIQRAIIELGFVYPMPVQEEVIPYLLGNRNDIIALAQTGTGKTAAYGIPLLQRINAEKRTTQAIVLCPTRELCIQITDDLHDFSKYMKGINIVPVYGGASIEMQIRALKHGAQIVVATPGRLIDLMNRGKAVLDDVHNVVLDEADEMLNMGFSESIDEILKGVPKDRNTLLFSATMSREIEKIAKTYLKGYKEIVVGSRNEGAENVNHIYYMVNAKDKYLALKRIVDYHPRIYAIIFCRTKQETQEIADKLIHDGYNAESLHGDLSQQQRELTMQKFRRHLIQLLVATDVAARGLDVDDLTHVVNYGMPDDVESYTHRSGRTGRAGKKGTSLVIIHSREQGKIKVAQKEIGKEFVREKIPTPREICTKQLYKAMDEIVKIDVDEEQIAPFMTEINRHFEYMDKEDIIKKMVSRTFGRFLSYYADAPEIELSDKEGGDLWQEKNSKKGKGKAKDSKRSSHKAEKGFRRLFINLGKADGFYPGEIMTFVNKHMEGRQEIGQIDLLNTISYIEVPERDVQRVTKALNGQYYKGREVRCNDAENGVNDGRGSRERGNKSSERKREEKRNTQKKQREISNNSTAKQRKKSTEFVVEKKRKDDWKQFFNSGNKNLKGEEPDFNEDGWVPIRPKK